MIMPNLFQKIKIDPVRNSPPKAIWARSAGGIFNGVKIKNPIRDLGRDRIFDVDRGGVEPLKQARKNAPGTLRTRPSDPRTYAISKYLNRKAPINRSFSEPRTIPFVAFLPTYPHHTPIKNHVNNPKLICG